jgi:hypothetical protein
MANHLVSPMQSRPSSPSMRDVQSTSTKNKPRSALKNGSNSQSGTPQRREVTFSEELQREKRSPHSPANNSPVGSVLRRSSSGGSGRSPAETSVDSRIPRYFEELDFSTVSHTSLDAALKQKESLRTPSTSSSPTREKLISSISPSTSKKDRSPSATKAFASLFQVRGCMLHRQMILCRAFDLFSIKFIN